MGDVVNFHFPHEIRTVSRRRLEAAPDAAIIVALCCGDWDWLGRNWRRRSAQRSGLTLISRYAVHSVIFKLLN
jgi:hypothetical protein